MSLHHVYIRLYKYTHIYICICVCVKVKLAAVIELLRAPQYQGTRAAWLRKEENERRLVVLGR